LVNFKKHFFEGPELYKIAGFAETLVKKNEKSNQLKLGRTTNNKFLQKKSIEGDDVEEQIKKI